ncbi:response regulator receiver modulated diguanylate cyclase [Devosia enhydra]|uniref:diguanylate cyclase n=1 Tax=Devosia enhydra TaxID=665118 RepID=A0A1K2HUK3_9HYPH|nr:PleD family two-component system response regulator [Devosia enhydra]SFZ81944.1 response regulator receiver modulated diguanylate cyclase [Devosia enhydra]
MTARVLIVDDVPANIRLLEARLSAEYFDVRAATSGPAALDLCFAGGVDVVLLDVMMPGMDGFEVCRRLKADPRTQHVPVLMITALDQQSDRVRGLQVGADDFISKPVDDLQLLARVRSLSRLKLLTDELRARARTGGDIAADDIMPAAESMTPDNARILLVDPDLRSARRTIEQLGARHDVEMLSEPEEVPARIAGGEFELVIVSMALGDHDPLRVASQLRTMEQARTLPILLVAEEADRARVMRGLDLGINDFILRPVEKSELLARVATQVRRHRYAQALRDNLSNTLALAITDQLTGLYNRRYFDRHLTLMMEKAREQDRDMAVMLIDMDYFKTVNDTHGHDVGDAVLREFALRLRRNIRGVDLPCRLGGEEFVVLMPDIDLRNAEGVAERVRSAVADRPFAGEDARSFGLTVSVGVALNELADDTPDSLLKRADVALYRAKREGRNRVIFDAA